MSEKQTLVVCEDTAFSYEGRTVVSGINLTVKSGEYLCVVGENGSGKSTLIRGILGVKSPSEGQITLSGDMKRDEIGYLPQQTPAQKDFPASVMEVVLSGRLSAMGMRPFYNSADRRAAVANLEKLGAAGLRNRCFRELSGGQRQRVLLARALCAARRLLVLDEPAAGLDPLVTSELYKIIAGLNEKDGLAVVMVSHDVKSAVKYASHILHLSGTPVFSGTAADYANSAAGKYFLDS